MKEQINRSRKRSSTHPARNPVSELSIEVATRMSQMNGIPSVSTLVVCLTEVRDRLPREFNEQITFLQSIARNLEVYLRKPGAETLASALEQIITHLKLCGEIPCYPFEVVVGQLQEMSGFQSRRYLDGLNGLARKDRWGGAERRLLTLLNYSTDQMLPFDWSEQEWKDFDRLVQHSQARIDALIGAPATPSETATAADSKTDSGSAGLLEWKGTVADLVYVIQALKDAELLEPTVTDEMVVNSVNFKSKARNRVEVIVNARYRLAHGETFTTRGKIERLRDHLLKNALPRPPKKEGDA